jgi:VWFA-related protein
MQRAAVLFAAFLLCTLCGGIAQQPSPPGSDAAQNSEPAHSQSPPSQLQPISIDVVVTDKAGNPVAGLSQADFTLLDNGRPASITGFSASDEDATGSAAPVEAVLVFDTVNTGFHEVSIARTQVTTFLRQNGGKLALPISVVWMTNGGWMELAAPSRDGNALAAQIDKADARLRSVPETNGFYGALQRFSLSVQMMEGVGVFEAGKPGRKLLIWIGPGWPLMDGAQVDVTYKDQVGFFANIVALSNELRQARIAMYSINLGVPNGNIFAYQDFVKGVKRVQLALPPNLNLKVLAVQSGGRVLIPSNDLAPELSDCLRDAGPSYRLSFLPPRADGPNEFHELKLKMQKSGLTARTSTGYYDQPLPVESQAQAR